MFNRINEFLVMSIPNFIGLETVCRLLFSMKIPYLIDAEEFQNRTIYYLAISVSEDEEKELISKILKVLDIRKAETQRE